MPSSRLQIVIDSSVQRKRGGGGWGRQKVGHSNKCRTFGPVSLPCDMLVHRGLWVRTTRVVPDPSMAGAPGPVRPVAPEGGLWDSAGEEPSSKNRPRVPRSYGVARRRCGNHSGCHGTGARQHYWNRKGAICCHIGRQREKHLKKSEINDQNGATSVVNWLQPNICGRNVAQY